MIPHKLRRRLLHNLAKAPSLYRTLLQFTGRSSFERESFLRLIRRGNVVFDVGANIGNYTVLFSDLVGPDGIVHAFEPVPLTYAILAEKIRLDAVYSNILANFFACSEDAGVVEIIVPGDDLGQASMQSHTSGSWSSATKTETFTVSTVRLDDYAVDQSLTRIDFFKCDAEGAELLVLKGARDLLTRFQPLLFLEVADFWIKDFGYNSTDLINFLEEVGYTDFVVEGAIVAVPQLRARVAELSLENSINLIAACSSQSGRLDAFRR